MKIEELNEKINKIDHNLEHFKALQEKRAEAPKAELQRIQEAIAEQKNRLNRLETSLARPEIKGNFVQNNDPYQELFCNYLKKGIETGLQNYEEKALLSGSPSEGGYLITPHMQQFIASEIKHSSPMRSLSSIATISTEALDLIEELDRDNYAGWTRETDPRESTNTPYFSKRVIPVHEIYAQPKATQKLIDDASINIEEWLQDKLATSFSALENHAFIHGNGEAMPRGILTYPQEGSEQAIEQLKVKESITTDDLLMLMFALEDKYLGRACFLMHRSVLQAIRMLKLPSGEPVWQASMQLGVPDTIFGIPVMQSNDMPHYSAGGLVVALADFKQAYQVVDRTGIRILRDPFTEKPFVKFYATKRVGGDVKNFQAIKLLNLKK